jgi:hypothetical protein
MTLAALGAIASVPPAAAAVQNLKLVNELPKPVVLTLTDASGSEQAAPLNLLIQNPSTFSGELRLRFFVQKSGRIVSVVRQGPSPAPTDRPVLLNIGGTLAIGKGQTRLVRLRFTLPKVTDPSLLDGMLVIKLSSNQAKAKAGGLVLQTQASLGTGPPLGTEAPQPAAPALQVTSFWPFRHSVLWGEHQTVLLPPKHDEVLGRRHEVILGSSSGGLLRVTVSTRRGEEAFANGMTKGSIRVDHVGSSGTYSGDVVLGPGKNDKFKLTVNVRDFFGWALLALGAGALLGGYGTRRWEGKRRKQLLVARARQAYDAYTQFIDRRRDTGLPPRPDAKGDLESLEKAIAVANTDDEYNKQVDEVAAYEAALNRYKRLATAATVLRLEDLPDQAGALKRDVADLRAELELRQTDAKSADQLADEADRLAAIVDAFIPVWKLWVLHGGDDQSLSPVGCYDHRGRFRTEAAAREVRVCLTERRHALEEREAASRVELLEAFREGARGRVAVELAGLDFSRSLTALRQGAWRRWEELTPAAIQRRVRMFDWAIAFASALVTLLAFLLTIYDANFGSIGDYAKAFTAGFAGQLAGAAIAWNLFPAFRSYRAVRTDAGTKPAAATTSAT